MTEVSCCPSDQQLVEVWLVRKDESAIAELIARYRPLVEAAVGRLLQDRGLAQDAIQETFLAFCEQAGDITGPLGAWLRGVAANQALQILRSHTRRQAREARVARAGSWRTRSDSELHAPEDLTAYCLASLSSAERDLMVKLFWENRTQQEVAVQLGVCPATIHKRVQACLDRLRRHLARRGFMVSATGLLACLGGLAGSTPESYAWMQAAAAGSKSLTTKIAVRASAAAAGAVFLILVWLGTSSSPVGNSTPLLSGDSDLRRPTGHTPSPPHQIGAPSRADDSQPPEHPTASPARPALPLSCSTVASETGWIDVDPSTWSYLVVIDGVPTRRRDLLARPWASRSGPRGLRVDLDAAGLLVPVPTTVAQGFQARISFKSLSAPPAAEPTTDIVTYLRCSAPTFDVLARTLFSAEAPALTCRLAPPASDPALVPAYVPNYPSQRYNTVVWTWHETVESQFPKELETVTPILASHLIIHRIQVRSLTDSERTAMNAYVANELAQIPVKVF